MLCLGPFPVSGLFLDQMKRLRLRRWLWKNLYLGREVLWYGSLVSLGHRRLFQNIIMEHHFRQTFWSEEVSMPNIGKQTVSGVFIRVKGQLLFLTDSWSGWQRILLLFHNHRSRFAASETKKEVNSHFCTRGCFQLIEEVDSFTSSKLLGFFYNSLQWVRNNRRGGRRSNCG